MAELVNNFHASERGNEKAALHESQREIQHLELMVIYGQGNARRHTFKGKIHEGFR